MNENNQKDMWDHVPEEFKSIIYDLSCSEKKYSIQDAILYLDVHKSDYGTSIMPAQAVLLMIEVLFGSPAFPSLYDYEEEFEDNQSRIRAILDEAEKISEKLIGDGLYEGYRTSECIKNKENVAILIQNMHVYNAYYYQKTHQKAEYEKELDIILKDTIANLTYVLNQEEGVAKALMDEERLDLDMDYVHGFCPFSEPLIILKETMYSEPAITVLYERLTDYLDSVKDNVTAKEECQAVLKEKRQDLDKLYWTEIENLDDEISLVEDNLVELVLERKNLYDRLHKNSGKIITEPYDGVNLPF